MPLPKEASGGQPSMLLISLLSGFLPLTPRGPSIGSIVTVLPAIFYQLPQKKKYKPWIMLQVPLSQAPGLSNGSPKPLQPHLVHPLRTWPSHASKHIECSADTDHRAIY
jgi:hypothetical protein